MKKGRVMAATAALLIVGIAVSMVFRQEGREILRLSPDASAVMRLNLEENGRAVLYRAEGRAVCGTVRYISLYGKGWREDPVAGRRRLRYHL